MNTDKIIEVLSAKVHDAWWEEKIKQDFHPPLICPHNVSKEDSTKFNKFCDKCHADMYPYEELADNIQEYDRVTVRAVLKAIGESGFALFSSSSEIIDVLIIWDTIMEMTKDESYDEDPDWYSMVRNATVRTKQILKTFEGSRNG